MSGHVHEHPPTPPELPFPIEIFQEVIQLLPLSDQKSLALTSQFVRRLTIHFIFRHLRYTNGTINKVRKILQARTDIKQVIRKLDLHVPYVNRPSSEIPFPVVEQDDATLVIKLLQSLPNLHSFELCQFYHHVPIFVMSQLIDSLRHAPLIELTLDTGLNVPIGGPPIVGLPGLKKLSIIWKVDDADEQPGSAHRSLYDLIQPSLSTLIDLCINDRPLRAGFNLDLRLLEPAGHNLQTFEYSFRSLDESVLYTIPVLFPHLSKLKIEWYNGVHPSLLWQDRYLNTLAMNRNITDLTLSHDFEVQARDALICNYDFARYVRSYERRLKATEKVASVCAKLQRCCWIQTDGNQFSSMEHPFVIFDRQALNGESSRVVRGVKQCWMGRNYCRRGAPVVKCKLENLPGDIIGDNDPPSP